MTATHSSRSVLGTHASRIERTGSTLAFDDSRHLQAHRWLVDEAWLLDAQANAQSLWPNSTDCPATSLSLQA